MSMGLGPVLQLYKTVMLFFIYLILYYAFLFPERLEKLFLVEACLYRTVVITITCMTHCSSSNFLSLR